MRLHPLLLTELNLKKFFKKEKELKKRNKELNDRLKAAEDGESDEKPYDIKKQLRELRREEIAVSSEKADEEAKIRQQELVFKRQQREKEREKWKANMESERQRRYEEERRIEEEIAEDDRKHDEETRKARLNRLGGNLGTAGNGSDDDVDDELDGWLKEQDEKRLRSGLDEKRRRDERERRRAEINKKFMEAEKDCNMDEDEDTRKRKERISKYRAMINGKAGADSDSD